MPPKHHSPPRPPDTGEVDPQAAAHDLSPASLADAIDESFAAQEPLLRERLTQLEARLQRADAATRERAAEQIALIHVGLGCLSDAIAELAAELSSPAHCGHQLRGPVPDEEPV